MKTWKEHKAAQEKAAERSRRKWLNEIAESGIGLSGASRQLGINRTQISQMMKKYGIKVISPPPVNITKRKKPEGPTLAEIRAAAKATKKREDAMRAKLRDEAKRLVSAGYKPQAALQEAARSMGAMQ